MLGAYQGRGKRTAVYGAFMLGCYNPDLEEFQTICKIGTGFSEEDLELLYNRLASAVVIKPKAYIDYNEMSNKPDVWFEPKLVFECLTADLTLSPIYRAARGLVETLSSLSNSHV